MDSIARQPAPRTRSRASQAAADGPDAAQAVAGNGTGRRPLRILFATEYLPPFISGIANRCKNLVNGYRQEGHDVTVFSVTGTDCDVVVPSIPNPFYRHQRVFVLPPWQLMLQLLDFSTPVPYDIAHIVAPLCLSFVLVIPFLKMRGVKVYVSYHVYLEFYKNRYLGSHPLADVIIYTLFTMLYYIPLVWLADCVGIPSKTADTYVFKYSQRIHYLRSGLDTSVFVPRRIGDDAPPPLHRTLSRASSRSSMSATKLIETPAIDSDLQISDLREFAGLGPNEGPLLVYVGRLAVEKNVEFLVQAMAHPAMATATLVIVGDGPMRTTLEDQARSIVGADRVFAPPTEPAARPPSADGGIADDARSDTADSAYAASNAPKSPTAATAGAAVAAGVSAAKPSLSQPRRRVIFTGMVLNEHQVASYYGQCDIFVSASASETFGFTVAEAMACGTPAVVVRSGAFATVYKMIDNWMFHEGDIDEYASRIQLVFRQGVAARRLARDIAVRGFSVDAAIRDLTRTYQWIVDGCQDREKQL
nr:Sulfoquinovosyl transferase sqd2 [Polyrhizophydium stewartii]